MSILKEFKEFAIKGNVIDLAVGVIIGGAFSAIVSALVDNVFMPVIGAITGGVNIADLSWTIGKGENPAVIQYGAFLNAIVNFILIALVLFLFVKAMNKLSRKTEEEPAPAPRICPFCKSEIPDDAVKCPHCTSDLPVEEVEEAAAE